MTVGGQWVHRRHCGPCKIPTLANLVLAFAFGFQLIESIRHGENLHSTYCGQHVSIMARCCTEPTIFMLAGENEIDDILSRESLWPTQEEECV
jgi:hypothetical protein